MEQSNCLGEVRDDKSSDRSSPASSVHSNSSHSTHSLRIVSDDHSSQGSVSRKHMLLNQYRKEQDRKSENINDSEPGLFQNANNVTDASFSDHSCSGRYAIDPSSSSESENNGTQEEKDDQPTSITSEPASNQNEAPLSLQQDISHNNVPVPGPSRENMNTPPTSIKKRAKRPNPLISETKKCQVCTAPAAKHIHYGATTCFSCRAFFRRSIQTSQSRNYVCRRQGNCKILPDTRKGCQKCRLEACLKIGMKPGWVLNEDERARRFRKLRQKKGESIVENVPSNALPQLEQVPVIEDDNHDKSQRKRLTPSPTAYAKRRRIEESFPQETMDLDYDQSSNLGYKRMYLQLREGRKKLDAGSLSNNSSTFSDAIKLEDSGYNHFKKGYKPQENVQHIERDHETSPSASNRLIGPAASEDIVEERRRFPRLDNTFGSFNATQPSYRDEIAEKSIAFLRDKPAELAGISNDPATRIWLGQKRISECSTNTEESRIRSRSGNELDSTFSSIKPIPPSLITTHSTIGSLPRSAPPLYAHNHRPPTTNPVENIYHGNQSIPSSTVTSFFLQENKGMRNEEQSRYLESSLTSSHPRQDYHGKRRDVSFMDDKVDLNNSYAPSPFSNPGAIATLSSKRPEQLMPNSRSSPDRTSRPIVPVRHPCFISVATRLEGMLVGPGEDEIRVVNELVDQHDKYYKSVNFGEDLIKEMIMSSIFGIPMGSNTAMSAYRLMVQRVTRVSKNFNDFSNLSVKVQGTLLKHNADLVVSLRGAAFFHMKTGLDQILTSLGFEDLETAKNMILTTLKSNSTKEGDYKKIEYKKFNTIQKTAEQSAAEHRYDSLLSRIGAAVTFNQNLVKLLSYILIFCSDFSDDEIDVSDRTNIEKSQEKLISIAQRYVFATYPEEMASSVFSNLMECLGNLRELCFIKSKRRAVQERKNDMNSPATMVH